MLNKLYEKSKIGFAILWIVAYCVLLSVGDGLSASVGVEKSITLPIALALTVILLVFVRNRGLFSVCGLCVPKTSPKNMLYYLPFVAMLTANFWCGVRLNYTPIETILYVLTMLLVGFLEELIFRGLLFDAMRENGFILAVCVSSVTFGIGHIINLFNGSGADLLPNILQVVYATAAGFAFVMVYCKSNSLISCIVTHGLFNAFSAFSVEVESVEIKILTCVLLTVISAFYAIYLALSIKASKKQ